MMLEDCVASESEVIRAIVSGYSPGFKAPGKPAKNEVSASKLSSAVETSVATHLH